MKNPFSSSRLPEKQLDDDAQPINRHFNAARLSDRKIDELIGLCKGIISDNVVVQLEAEFFQQWLKNNIDISDHWPANILYKRIEEILEDNFLDSDEAKELFETLKEITGKHCLKISQEDMSTSLPLTKPDPEVSFDNKVFCFTGKFVTGIRKKCEAIIIDNGGDTRKKPTFDTDYLVIGLIGSAEWIHSTHGRKIEKAVEIREQGHDIKIISEEYWVKYI